MEALDFETEPASKVASARLERIGALMAPVSWMLRRAPALTFLQDIARGGAIEVSVICNP